MTESFPLTVDSRARIPLSALSESVQDALREAFTHLNPNEDAAEPYERTWRVEHGDLTFPRGGMPRLRAGLQGAGLAYHVVDRRCSGDWALLDDGWADLTDGMPTHRVTLWDFQEPAVAEMVACQNRIFRSPTGSGKSTALLAAISRTKVPAIVMVRTGGLHEQWVERVSKELGVPKDRVGTIGDGKSRTAPVTIAMQQTLASRGIDPVHLRAFGTVVMDEVQSAAAETVFDALDPWPAQYRFGASADETRHDRRDYLIRDLFGDAIDVDASEVMESGNVLEVEIRVVPTGFSAGWYKVAVASGNVFRMRAAHQKLLKAMAEDPRRNDIAAKIVAEEAAAGEQTMVLSLRRKHCLVLDRIFTSMGLRTGVMLGGKESSAEFARTKQGIRDGTIRVITGTIAAVGTGQDFPSVSRGVLVMPLTNNRQLFGQVRGRFCRACEATGKTEGILYVLWDKDLQGRKALENLAAWNRNVTVQSESGDAWVNVKEFLSEWPRRNKR